MKIKPEHYETLKENAIPFLNSYNFTLYREKGLSHKRFRWDACCYMPGMINFICETLYEYLDDTHIDSAFRKITRDAGFSESDY